MLVREKREECKLRRRWWEAGAQTRWRAEASSIDDDVHELRMRVDFESPETLFATTTRLPLASSKDIQAWSVWTGRQSASDLDVASSPRASAGQHSF
jgi:hypothetical protein